MILAAGRGERMRPLTDSVPKPLLEAGGKPLIVWHIERLAQAGIRDIVINHAHLGAQIEAALGDGSRFGVTLHYSPEAEALETAGGIANALPLLGEEPFLVVNGDTFCEFDFAKLVQKGHALGERMAWLLMVDNPPQHPHGDFFLEGNRLVEQGARALTFSGIGVYRPALFADIPRGSKAPLAPLLRAQIAAGTVGGERHRGLWQDIGTPERLRALDARLRHRPVRSFVLRQGRVSNAQHRALEILLPRYGIPYQEEVLDLDQTFGRVAPKMLEIGFGMGETTARIAQAHPENDYLGIEVHSPGVGGLLKQIEALGLRNVRLIQHDAVEVLEHMLAPASLDGVHIFFPDPWPKKRHHKRRLIQPDFVARLCSRLKPGGYLHAATDWQAYAEHILETFAAEPQLANTADAYAPRPAYRPLTKFEQRGLRLGHGVWDIVFRRRA